ncbi:MAG TPA: hypothetical protein VLT86_01660 [Vicinamibacterales bacterium]|nr:hypothetical protein [Vicinamibacterales bacterium]
MAVTRQTLAAFHATGRRLGDELAPMAGLDLRPILLARHRDLTTLRYDFPIVLVADDDGDGCARSLSGIIDDLIGALAHADARLASDLLKVELTIRSLVASGQRGSLSNLWDAAAGRLQAHGDKALHDSLKRARGALSVDGELVDCDGELPRRLFEHAWRLEHERKAARFRARTTRLINRLRELLRGDFARSGAARSIEHLRASFAGQSDAFDFGAMARMLSRTAPGGTMAESRRRRIAALIEALESQRLYPAPGKSGDRFIFDSCATAVAAYRERLPALVELARSLAIAELEVAGVYDEARHDAFFGQSDTDVPVFDADDLAMFPDYFVLVDAGDMDSAEPAAIVDALSAGLPMKVLFQADLHGAPLAHMAMGLATAFVLQAPGSHLYLMRRHVAAGFASRGSALFSVFSGADSNVAGLPPYLVAAAALESRAFPAFAYDPAAGADWASRIDLSANPQPDRDWPVHEAAYEDPQHQHVSADLAFTYADFAACDRRYARHFAVVPRTRWTDATRPVSEWLAGSSREPLGAPSLLMVDRDNRLQRVLADETILRTARQCRDRWRSLQALGRIHETPIARPTEPVPTPATEAAAAPVPAAPDASVAHPAEPRGSSDEPYIETPRCSTCNECIQINNRMFAYNDNRQAYIADVRAGTYRQLVEAAEGCQVSIIHPGKPHDLNEPGLDELVARAQPFQ